MMTSRMPAMPAIAGVHLVGALDALKIAADALGGPELGEMRAVVDLLLEVFAGVEDAVRLPVAFYGMRRMLGEEADARKRAGLALEFAGANFDEVLDALDDGDAWAGRAMAARAVLELVHGAVKGRRGGGASMN